MESYDFICWLFKDTIRIKVIRMVYNLIVICVFIVGLQVIFEKLSLPETIKQITIAVLNVIIIGYAIWQTFEVYEEEITNIWRKAEKWVKRNEQSRKTKNGKGNKKAIPTGKKYIERRRRNKGNPRRQKRTSRQNTR